MNTEIAGKSSALLNVLLTLLFLITLCDGAALLGQGMFHPLLGSSFSHSLLTIYLPQERRDAQIDCVLPYKRCGDICCEPDAQCDPNGFCLVLPPLPSLPTPPLPLPTSRSISPQPTCLPPQKQCVGFCCPANSECGPGEQCSIRNSAGKKGGG